MIKKIIKLVLKCLEFVNNDEKLWNYFGEKWLYWMIINYVKRFFVCDRVINECVGGDGGWINWI